MLKTKDFLLQEFVNLQKWLFLAFQHSNPHKRLETKGKVAFSDDLCLVVGVAGFEPTTPCPPDKCATRLRYTPMDFLIQHFEFFCKFFILPNDTFFNDKEVF